MHCTQRLETCGAEVLQWEWTVWKTLPFLNQGPAFRAAAQSQPWYRSSLTSLLSRVLFFMVQKLKQIICWLELSIKNLLHWWSLACLSLLYPSVIFEISMAIFLLSPFCPIWTLQILFSLPAPNTGHRQRAGQAPGCGWYKQGIHS